MKRPTFLKIAKFKRKTERKPEGNCLKSRDSGPNHHVNYKLSNSAANLQSTGGIRFLSKGCFK